MKTTLQFLAPLLVWAIGAQAQVPGLINYQGKVQVNGINYHSSGAFKFALVNAAGDTTWWSHDGSSAGGNEPTGDAITLTVTRGVFAVNLGDTTVPNMTQTIPASVFANSAVYLRVWFDDGTNGFQQLTPDRRIAAVGYALMADTADSANTATTVVDGAITAAKLAPGAVGSSQLASGAVGATQMAAGAAAANLNGSGLSGVGGGGLILSAAEVNPSLQAAGYVRIGTTQVGDVWQEHVAAPAPDARCAYTAVWTGSEMIVWGGSSDVGSYFNDTWSYTPGRTMFLYLKP